MCWEEIGFKNVFCQPSYNTCFYICVTVNFTVFGIRVYSIHVKFTSKTCILVNFSCVVVILTVNYGHPFCPPITVKFTIFFSMKKIQHDHTIDYFFSVGIMTILLRVEWQIKKLIIVTMVLENWREKYSIRRVF